MQRLRAFQSIILAGGALFSWTALMSQFRAFYDLYGTIFRIHDCTIPNPLVTACFYGSLAMLIALVWSVLLFFEYREKSQRYLYYLLSFGAVFAALVAIYEFLEYYHIFSFGQAVSCLPGSFPLTTPCFYGMLFFLGAAFTARTILHQNKN